MICPVCGGKLKVIQSWTTGSGVLKRSRECARCYTEFQTSEKINFERLPQYILDKLHEKAGSR